MRFIFRGVADDTIGSLRPPKTMPPIVSPTSLRRDFMEPTESSRRPLSPVEFESRALALLRGEGMRITTPRTEVIRVLARTDRALNAYGVHEAVLAGGRKIDVVSVYRILSTLESLGLIARLGLLDGYFPRRFPMDASRGAEKGGEARVTAVLVEPESRRVREIECDAELSARLRACFLAHAPEIGEISIEAAVPEGGLDGAVLR